MKSTHAQHVSSLLAGALFGVGLLVSGMTQPDKVLGFLDPFGQFDASLIFVMLGAIGVHFLGSRYRTRRSAPLFGAAFVVPSRRDIDAKLLLGALLFGMGWGLGGYCPGPALVSLPGGRLGTLVFAVSMIAGMFATAKLESFLRNGGSHAVSTTIRSRFLDLYLSTRRRELARGGDHRSGDRTVRSRS